MNKVTKAERERIYARAVELVAAGGGPDLVNYRGVVDTLITEFDISEGRAGNAASRAIRVLRGREIAARRSR